MGLQLPMAFRISRPLVLEVLAWCAALVATCALFVSLHPTWRAVFRAISPTSAYDSARPALPDLRDPAILVFSKTNGFRHFEAIEVGSKSLRAMASGRGWSIFHTENGAVFDEQVLSRFRVVVWLNASGAPLDQNQRSALRSWLEGGGGYVGIHAASDGSHSSWEWYRRSVVGAGFTGHPMPIQPARVNVEKADHPATVDLPSHWTHSDEWYSFDRSVRGDPGVEVLASLDESTYDTRFQFLGADEDLAMGDHPAIWARTVGEGRALIAIPGHTGRALADRHYLSVVEGAMEWAGRIGGADAGTSAEPSVPES